MKVPSVDGAWLALSAKVLLTWAREGAECAQGLAQPCQIVPWLADCGRRFGSANVPGEIFT
jgi:hypothetical protein